MSYAQASDAPVTWRLSSSTDGWAAVNNGARRNAAALNKIDAAITVDGHAVGVEWLGAHASYFHVIGHGPSERLVGDGHGIDNAESEPDHRLLEAWIEARLAPNASMRIGLMDLNTQFDVTDTASLFLNSGHGMGTEFAASGVNGPSIYPATGLGISGATTWSGLTLQAAVVDGAPDAAAHGGLASVRLRGRDGALIVGQARYAFGPDGPSLGLGVYRYSRAPVSSPNATPWRQGGGIYATAELPILRGLDAWLRVGFADTAISDVHHQISGGIVRHAPFPGREDDRVGLAVSTIGVRPDGPGRIGYSRVETNVELTYHLVLSETVSLQPDVQYVLRPAYDPDSESALLVGLRLAVSFGSRDR
jgi:porin